MGAINVGFIVLEFLLTATRFSMWSTVKTYLTHEKFNINDFEAVIEDNPFTKSKTELFLAVDQIHDFAL